ncbi:MAG: type II toxin-antitoxin system RelE family toxin [Mycobacteriales bacterium]
MTYRVQLHRRAEKALKKLDQATQNRVAPVLLQLREQPRPHGSRKLTNSDNLWRVRVGDYRIVYTIRDDVLVVLVLEILRRDDRTYKQLP